MMGRALLKLLGLFAIIMALLFAIVLYRFCGTQTLRSGSFEFICQHGGGILDGYFCEANLGHPYYIMFSTEFPEVKPYLAFKTEVGSAGILDLPEGVFITHVGHDKDQIVARTNDGNTHMFMRTERPPSSIGVLDKKALAAYLRITPIPELKPVTNATR